MLTTRPLLLLCLSIEFQLREFNTGSFPRGLSLMLGSMSNWIYERDPTSNIKFESALAALKSDLESRGDSVFTGLLKRFLIENTHRSTIEMVPDTALEKKQVDEEKVREGGATRGQEETRDDKAPTYAIPEYASLRPSPTLRSRFAPASLPLRSRFTPRRPSSLRLSPICLTTSSTR
jgi:hypothetical protein